MKNTSTVTASVLLLVVLVAINVQLVLAQLPPCGLLSCGAGTFVTGGIDSGKACPSGTHCWWNDCTQRAGNPCVTSRSYHCNPGGPIGCPNEPCSGQNIACSGESDCCNPYICNAENRCAMGSPLMVNLENNSSNYRLTSYTDGVVFDINAKGVPLRVGWTERDTSIGILALDRNNNGTVDDGAELFGTATRKRDGSLAAHGFDALLDLDGGPRTSDGRVDAHDPSYGLIRVWIDANHDGVSQPHELMSLVDAGVTALFTDYRETPRMDRYGNLYTYEGSARILKGGREYRHKMFDVFLIAAAAIQ